MTLHWPSVECQLSTQSADRAAHILAVVGIAAALAGKPAVLGYLPGGKQPGQFRTQTGGQYLLVPANGSAKIQMVNLSDLP